MLILIHDALRAIQYTWTILNFTILAQYIFYDKKTLRYIEHALYRLEKTNIAFENHWPLVPKLCQLIFNYPKFYTISHFV